MKNRIYFLSLILAFVFLSVLIISKHEIWRDEGRAWLIAGSAEYLPTLFKALKYDGTPALWHLILNPFAKAGLPIITMSILHFLIIFSAILIFLRLSPFSLLHKTLFIFGYYILYEYNTIARSYSLTVLFLFITASIYKYRFKKPYLYFITISLLATSNLHSLCISIALVLFYFYEIIAGETASNHFEKNIDNKIFTYKHFMAALIFGSTLLFCVYQLLPPSDLTRTLTGWKGSKLSTIPNALISAFFPVQIPQLNFWNTKLLYYPDTGRYFWGFPLLLMSLLVFIRKPRAMAIYSLTSLSLLALFALKYGGSTRHHGLIFILFIFSLWIAENYKEYSFFPGKKTNNIFSVRTINIIFTILLIFQVLASPIPAYFDNKYDFSAGKKAANYLQNNKFLNEDTFVCVYDFFSAEAILPYTKTGFYSIENSKFERFIIFNTGCDKAFETTIKYKTDIIDKATAGKNYKNIILILNSENKDQNFLKAYKMTAYFDKTIVRDESYYIYLKK
ncbi:MAG: hypothetical protein A2452_08230 [Candidatus Firestonebacteria bacterium RIFOXYC2_FULL_39_67]|nr:MAG: hypothetical protein A2536_01390 [Candidatus Firestonebacteria bacterium RIFOXYD2_FULL_39_29]OGF53804.1 MAG: hypothetical protein A2452_08230 [Candidatus Firestonebacteria bacterium RIFOXYC2_FULL_39_67]